MQGKGANIEAVIRLEGGEKGDSITNNKSSKPEDTGDNSVIKLVDAQDNQFVLAKGKDSTVPHEDHHLIQVGVIERSIYCNSGLYKK